MRSALLAFVLIAGCGGDSKTRTADTSPPTKNDAADTKVDEEPEAVVVSTLGLADVDGDMLRIDLQVHVLNYSKNERNLERELILGVSGMTDASADGDPRVALDGRGVIVAGTMAAEEQINANVSFSIPVKSGVALLDWTLPFGLFNSQLAVRHFPNIAFDGLPPETKKKTVTTDQRFRVMEFSVRPQKAFRVQIAGLPFVAESSCRSLRPAFSNKTFEFIEPSAADAVNALDFEADNLAGQTIKLSDYQRSAKSAGKSVVAHFWATWCPPCQEEIPALARLQDKLGSDAVVLALTSDPPQNQIPSALSPASLTILRDAPAKPGAVGKIADQYGTERLPETYLIDRSGKLRYYFIGKRDWDSSEALDCIKSL